MWDGGTDGLEERSTENSSQFNCVIVVRERERGGCEADEEEEE